jgi:hypothetical protein
VPCLYDAHKGAVAQVKIELIFHEDQIKTIKLKLYNTPHAGQDWFKIVKLTGCESQFVE